MKSQRNWYQDAILYELRIPSFYDSDGDGIGDIKGLTEKLDYLQDLGVNTIWLLPFYPSPLRDDGYDIADYTNVHPDYGSLRDLRMLLREAHRRELRVVGELVMNHTSDRHPWFQRARKAPPGSAHRDFYVWSDSTERYTDARIIFKDFEPSNWSWDPVAKAYYWHRFFSHQPDLNFDNPRVMKAMLQVLDFWFEMGLDGLRLDAIPYLFEREGTSCENLPETHAALKKVRAHVDRHFKNRMLLAEANQWPEDAVAYFGEGDECHMAFHFPIMPRLFMSMHMEDRFPIIDILDQTPSIPDNCQWALFLRNHDELTLEMVTDEERDYMWRVYAHDPRARINLGIRRRLAPLLDNNRRKIELMNALLFSLPGTPVLYYGDEIGMGDNVYLGDRNGVRTPMQWSPDRNAGFSTANPQRLFLPVVSDPEYHYETVNVETQQRNPSSLLWWTKRLIGQRKRYRAFGQGTLEVLKPQNRRVLAFLRRFEDEKLLIVANLSRFSQYVELDLSEFRGLVPMELFGRIEFPPIGDLPYLLTLGPHGFFWFSLEQPKRHARPMEPAADGLPGVPVQRSWDDLFQGRTRLAMEALLPSFFERQRWFRGKGRAIAACHFADMLPVDSGALRLLFVDVEYVEGEKETYIVPVAFDERATSDDAMVTIEKDGEVIGTLKDASADPRLGEQLFRIVERRRRLKGEHIELVGAPAPGLRAATAQMGERTVRALRTEQSNTSFSVGSTVLAKLVRRVDEGMSPEIELGRHLTERARFSHSPAMLGHVELRRDKQSSATLLVLNGFVPNEGNAWTLFVDRVVRLFEEVVARRPSIEQTRIIGRIESAGPEDPKEAAPSLRELPVVIDVSLARLLGQRTAELHAALAADDDPALTPEPATPFSQRSAYQSLRNLGVRVLTDLRARAPSLPKELSEITQRILDAESRIMKILKQSMDAKGAGKLIRCHGDYHLGQVLFTGKDFVIIDFEGEPARSLAERRRKRSPLMDVAGMIRSFDYAVESVLAGTTEQNRLRIQDRAELAPWARLWFSSMQNAFVESYLEVIKPARLVPPKLPDVDRVLALHLLEKALYEVGYELHNRPQWLGIPLRGLVDILEKEDAS